MAVQTRRHKLELLRSQCEAERSTFIEHWKEIGDNLAPRRPRFYTSDVNKGDRRNNKITHTSPILSFRSLKAGMMGGITSPARPWFQLTIPDFDQRDSGPVKDWLDDTTRRMNAVFSRSNVYNVLLNIYGDLGYFGTAAMLVEEDFDYILRCYAVPIGSYSIGISDKLKVEIFFREFTMTVHQIVQKFGTDRDGKIHWDNISSTVRNHFENNNLNHNITIIHAVTPNELFDEAKFESKFKKFRSTYYERGTETTGMATGDDIYLSDKGYDYFPVLVPRWETTGEDAWGTNCPGMEALGDVKQLYLQQRRLASAIELMVKPPMKGPTSLKTTKASIIPGSITYTDERSGNQGFTPVFQIEPRVQELWQLQQQISDRISKACYEDLFLMMSESDRRDITAREIDERHEEKLLALGPVLEQLNQDLLDPLIEIAFNFMIQQGLIDPPPQQIRGANVRVEYISIMAQAQKLAGLSNIDRFSQYFTQVLSVDPSAAAHVDTGNLLDWYADICSMRAGVIRSSEAVQAIKDAQAQAQAQQQKAQMLLAATQGAKNLGQADLSGDNALSRLVDQSNAGNPLTPPGMAS